MLVSAIIFVVVDFIYLNLIKDFFGKQIKSVQGSEIKVKMLPDTAEPTVGDGCMAFWSDTSGSLPYDVWLLFKPVGASQVKVKLV